MRIASAGRWPTSSARGEPLKATQDQIDRHLLRGREGRPEGPPENMGDVPSHRRRGRTISRGRRPIVPSTLSSAIRRPGRASEDQTAVTPQNVGSQRLLDIAARGEVHDRALWYPYCHCYQRPRRVDCAWSGPHAPSLIRSWTMSTSAVNSSPSVAMTT